MKKNKSALSRRKFIQHSATIAAAVSASGLLSSFSAFGEEKTMVKGIMRRKLGKTGMDISILTFGGGSQFLRNPNGDWEKILEAAVEGGINLFDTAPSYTSASFNVGGAKSPDSEDRYGEILPKYRNQIYLTTKLESRDPEKAKASVEASLKRLKTDHVDIIYIHGITPQDNTAQIENGLYKVMQEMKSSGMVKFIGISSMDSAERSKEMLDKLDFDVALLAMNATKYGDYANTALPSAIKKNTGVISMKVFRDIVGDNAAPKELLDHAWTQKGVSGVLIGHYGLASLEENLKITREFSQTGSSDIDRHELETRLAGLGGPHVLSWARPGYTDGGLTLV